MEEEAEEVPALESSEIVEVKVEQLDDSTHYPSLQSPGAFNTAASTSGAGNTGYTFSGASSIKTPSSQPQVIM